MKCHIETKTYHAEESSSPSPSLSPALNKELPFFTIPPLNKNVIFPFFQQKSRTDIFHDKKLKSFYKATF